MSLNKYNKPLRIELTPSIIYLRLIHYSHLFTALFCLYLLTLQWWTALFLPLLFISYNRTLKRYQFNSLYSLLRLYADGRCQGYSKDGTQQFGWKIVQTAFLPGLVIIKLDWQQKSEYRLLFIDAMTRLHWQQLQLFLRFALETNVEV